MKVKTRDAIDDCLRLFSTMCIIAAVCIFMWSSIWHHTGEYARINKVMDGGDGKIGIVQYKSVLHNTYVVRYVKEVKYADGDKTKFTRTYVDGEYYRAENLDFISDDHIVEENGQFKEK